jgi:hypothetical protein
MVSRREWAEPASSVKPCRNKLGTNHCAWKQHGDRASHGEGSGGAHGMRGHRLAVGDVGAVCVWTRRGCIIAFDHDSGRSCRKPEPGLVGRCCKPECLTSIESSRVRLDVCDGAWGGAGHSATHCGGSSGAHGMRGHRMGVGDVGEVSCELWGVWYPSSSDDSRITRRKQEPGLVCRQGCYQPDEQLQSRRDRRGVCDRARLGLVFDRTHQQGPLVLDGMPGHRLGVRDIGEMPSRSRSSGHTTAGHDGRPGQRQCESGMVC